MSLYAMSDLHISKGAANKPMDVFGNLWLGYMEKIEKNCGEILTDNDTLLVAGDVSWATYAKDTVADLDFINRIPGKKIISKGNHDYWWTSLAKLNELKAKHRFDTINFLHNNFYAYENIAICGNRGWTPAQSPQDKKIFNREIIRLELSLESAEKSGFKEKYVMTHYPPFGADGVLSEIAALFEKYSVTTCVYGHLHNTRSAVEGVYGNTKYILTSADYIGFCPVLLKR